MLVVNFPATLTLRCTHSTFSAATSTCLWSSLSLFQMSGTATRGLSLFQMSDTNIRGLSLFQMSGNATSGG